MEEGVPQEMNPAIQFQILDLVIWFSLTLDTYLIMLSVKHRGIKNHFWVFGMIRPGIELQSPRPLANTAH